jgi:hypothetical protein
MFVVTRHTFPKTPFCVMTSCLALLLQSILVIHVLKLIFHFLILHDFMHAYLSELHTFLYPFSVHFFLIFPFQFALRIKPFSSLSMITLPCFPCLADPHCLTMSSFHLYVNSNLVQYLLQIDIQKRTEKIQWKIQTLHKDFSPGNPNWEKPTYIIFIHHVTLFTIQYTYRS